MSTTGQFSSKNPTIKRILKEASELANQPSSDYHASPLETDLFEWHFTLRGPPEPSPYAGGIYHGRIVLPPAYPLKPPSFRFTTPSGRFEVNREICLSISGHHEETWQPAWGIRTALVAIRSFMDTSAGGQLGGMEASEAVRKRLAGQSPAVTCPVCAKSNAEIMQEQDEAVKANGGDDAKKEDVVPEELRLAYREDLGEKQRNESETQHAAAPAVSTASPTSPPAAAVVPETPATARPHPSQALSVQLAQQVPPQQAPPAARQQPEVPAWIDKAIYGIIVALIFLFWKKLVVWVS